jgi:hypothetical protein
MHVTSYLRLLGQYLRVCVTQHGMVWIAAGVSFRDPGFRAWGTIRVREYPLDVIEGCHPNPKP